MQFNIDWDDLTEKVARIVREGYLFFIYKMGAGPGLYWARGKEFPSRGCAFPSLKDAFN